MPVISAGKNNRSAIGRICGIGEDDLVFGIDDPQRHMRQAFFGTDERINFDIGGP